MGVIVRMRMRMIVIVAVSVIKVVVAFSDFEFHPAYLRAIGVLDANRHDIASDAKLMHITHTPKCD